MQSSHGDVINALSWSVGDWSSSTWQDIRNLAVPGVGTEEE